MNTVIDCVRDLWSAMRCVGELLAYLLPSIIVFFWNRASLTARLLAAESQLGMCKRRTDRLLDRFGIGQAKCVRVADDRPVEAGVDVNVVGGGDGGAVLVGWGGQKFLPERVGVDKATVADGLERHREADGGPFLAGPGGVP